MKILVCLFVFVILLTPLFENSYAQQQEPKKLKPIIFLQERIYDKNGNLVGYLQPRLQIFDLNRTIAWVAPQATKCNVIFEGHNYTLMKFVDKLGGSHIGTIGYYYVWVAINGHHTTIFRAWHDTYLTETGDVPRIYWEILVPS